MPLAMLRCSNRVPDNAVEALVAAIPVALAEAFDCEDEGGDLTPNDIEVEVSTVGPKDRNDYDVCITVFANDFPSRKANHDERRQRMQDALAQHVPADMTGYLWTLLAPASFGEFNK